jgi:hypothetical protein
MVETCPFCSAEINEKNECKVACPGYRNPKERSKHARMLGLTTKSEATKSGEVKQKW